MKTDSELYVLFQGGPMLLADLLGFERGPRYQFEAKDLKRLQRRVDGILTSDRSPVSWIVEFHGYPKRTKDKDIYLSTVAAMVQYQSENLGSLVGGAIIFLNPRHDPKTSPWHQIFTAGHVYFKVYYLQDLLRELAQRKRDHVLLDVFHPLVCEDREQLKQDAPRCLAHIRAARMPAKTKAGVLEAFGSWLLAKLVNDQEVAEMLNKYPILKGTAAGDYFLKLGKEIGEKRGVKIGEERGEKRGLKRGEERGLKRGEERGVKIGEVLGQLNLLEKQFKQGILTEPQYQKSVAPLRRKLEKLRKTTEDLPTLNGSEAGDR